jgi:hypothetical protein
MSASDLATRQQLRRAVIASTMFKSRLSGHSSGKHHLRIAWNSHRITGTPHTSENGYFSDP